MESIERQTLEDFLVDASVGNTWGSSFVVYGDTVSLKEFCDIDDSSQDVVHTFTFQQLEDEIYKYCNEFGHYVTDWIEGQYDATDADNIVQRVIFGEVVYG